MAEQLVITRGELGLPNLELNAPASGFWLFGKTGFTLPTLDRKFADPAMWVHGEIPTHIRQVNGTYTCQVVISGANPTQVDNRAYVLERAFTQQIEFELIHTLDGLTRRFRCIAGDMAEWTEERNFAASFRKRGQYPLRFTGPHRGRIRD